MSKLFTSLGVATLLTYCSTTFASAPPYGDEPQRLALVIRQLDTIARLTSPVAAPLAEQNARYAFDYARLSADLNLIRQGINGYLTPSRAQPRNPPELTGHYTRSTQDQP